VFEDAYVIPLVDTFDDIKRCLGAVSVELPTAEDFEDSKTVEPSIIDKPVSEVPTIESLESAAPDTSPRKVTQPRKFVCRVDETRPFLNLISCEWSPKFATRRDLDYSIENMPYVEARAELGVEDNVETGGGPGEEESVVRAFMRGHEESDVCLPEADKVEAFCFGANLESLRAETGKVSEPFVAWLDERSFAAGKGRSRSYRGPLTARDLYKELKKPVRPLILTRISKGHGCSCDFILALPLWWTQPFNW
jgi:hypothetical protein